MVARVLTESIAKDRLEVVQFAIDGLQYAQRRKGLNRVQVAALEALERLYMLTVRHRDALIPEEAMRRPLAVAKAAVDAAW